MESLHLDFETYSEVDVTKVGAWAYSRHPSTRVICAFWAIGDEEPWGVINIDAIEPGVKAPEGVTFEDDERIRFIIEYAMDGCTVHAFNTFFEWCIWVNVLGGDPIPFEQMDDTEARAAAAGLPRSLDQCCAALELPEDLRKASLEGRALIHKLCKPQKKKGEEYRNKDPEQVIALAKYCARDVIAERAVSKQIKALTPSEKALWVMDQQINAKGIRIDVKSAKAAIGLVNQVLDKGDAQVKEISDGAVEGLSKVAQIKKWSASLGYEIESLGKAELPKMLASDMTPEPVKQVLALRQELAKTSTAKYKKMLQVADRKDHRIRGMLRFHGASTGRWSGSLVQIQNIPRGSFKDVDNCIELFRGHDAVDEIDMIYGNPMEALSTCLRGMIIPSKGKQFYVFDFSQIEARLIAWIAGQDDTVKVFASGQDIYKHTAAKIYHKQVEAVTDDERFVGKTATLALGYQGGYRAFIGMAKNYGVETITEEFAKETVAKWREANVSIVAFWYALNEAAVKATQNKGTVYWVMNKKVGFVNKGKWLLCRLPSGRTLHYYKPKLAKDQYGDKVSYMVRDSQSGHYVRRDTYGGLLAENVTQATARDIMAEKFHKLRGAGFEPVFTVHDEVITEAAPGKDIQQVYDIAEEVPTWAKGLPIGADGYTAMRYRK